MSIYDNLSNLQWIYQIPAKLKLKTEGILYQNHQQNNPWLSGCKISHNFCSFKRNKRCTSTYTGFHRTNASFWLVKLILWSIFGFSLPFQPLVDNVFDMSVERKKNYYENMYLGFIFASHLLFDETDTIFVISIRN